MNKRTKIRNMEKIYRQELKYKKRIFESLEINHKLMKYQRTYMKKLRRKKDFRRIFCKGFKLMNAKGLQDMLSISFTRQMD